MALSRRATARVLRLCQDNGKVQICAAARPFATYASCTQRKVGSTRLKEMTTIRSLQTSSKSAITGQEAPSAQAYINSGVLAGKKDLVDVKKVLVIGSGGLSIGQAGEFDYSGLSSPSSESEIRRTSGSACYGRY